MVVRRIAIVVATLHVGRLRLYKSFNHKPMHQEGPLDSCSAKPEGNTPAAGRVDLLGPDALRHSVCGAVTTSHHARHSPNAAPVGNLVVALKPNYRQPLLAGNVCHVEPLTRFGHAPGLFAQMRGSLLSLSILYPPMPAEVRQQMHEH